ncbi:bifunctional cobalt-precorrin-7 (C(5))-methyltransferase CbiE/decarboxylating cobalt-precorrin-6B (C(15))-methyltransferase CbiT [Acidithrix sp. C25]|uniref:bifunctional cobalt-precorrin-7 (C(5))-methyltransferase/cobalt-precorrin-6B (C(15))-methyltransferase n=1 Tax=Acidithrix sp. C25 TaxID=1671482 RepID=UPI00191BA35E|nr:bifunctional cobalt-precorrin-7 (C(5))-methyltransferase CbiE/decarboxylating cobalt-precorrin-6B (C(15))-methyltransferase CbiT [Acidithrix sp. C25]
MPTEIFILGIEGDLTQRIPPHWLGQLRGEIVILSRSSYLKNLQLPPSIQIASTHLFDEGYTKALMQAVTFDGPILVLASGDPAFFGPIPSLRRIFPEVPLHICPKPSSISRAFGLLGMNWEDAAVISGVGRDLDLFERELGGHLRLGVHKIAVLTSKTTPPSYVVQKIYEFSRTDYEIEIATDLNHSSQAIYGAPFEMDEIDKKALAIVIAYQKDAKTRDSPAVSTSKLADAFNPKSKRFSQFEFDSFGSMITKKEIRELVVGKIAPWRLPFGTLVLDIGAGSGSVGLEVARQRPDLQLVAIERRHESIEIIKENASRLELAIKVIEGDAIDYLDKISTPSSIFVGGGGTEILEEVVRLFGTKSIIVATSATLENAQRTHDLLGNQVMAQIYRTTPLGKSGNRIDGYNPVFISWNEKAQL